MPAYKIGTEGHKIAVEKRRAAIAERYGSYENYLIACKIWAKKGGKVKNSNKGFGSNKERAIASGRIGGLAKKKKVYNN